MKDYRMSYIHVNSLIQPRKTIKQKFDKNRQSVTIKYMRSWYYGLPFVIYSPHLCKIESPSRSPVSKQAYKSYLLD